MKITEKKDRLLIEQAFGWQKLIEFKTVCTGLTITAEMYGVSTEIQITDKQAIKLRKWLEANE